MALTKEEVIENAEHQVEILTDRFDAELPKTINKLSILIKTGNFEDASIVTHNLGGEAATFGWPVIGDYAAGLSKILQEPNIQKRQQLVAVGLRSLELLCQKSMKNEIDAANNLLQEFNQAVTVLQGKKQAKG